MMLNAEFRRNLWLELRTVRLVGLAVLTALIVAFLEAGGRFVDLSSGYVVAGKWGFFLSVVLWGTRRAAAGIGQEVRSGTWDWQRLSAMGPWSMTWGKLFGATVFPWLAGLVFLAMVLIGRLSGAEAPRIWSGGGLAHELASILFDGLLAQAVALGLALLFLRKLRPARQISVSLAQVLALLAYFVMSGADGSFLGFEQARSVLPAGFSFVEWYAWRIPAPLFIVASKAFFTAAAIVGCYRLMRQELQLATWPWGWVAFLVLLAAYLNGLMLGGCADCASSISLQLFLFFAVIGAGAYLALFAERKQAHELAQFSRRLCAGERSALEWMPLWLPNVVLALALGAVVFALGSGATTGRGGGDFAWLAGELDRYLRPMVLAAMILMIRDYAIVLGFSFSTAERRADMTALFWLALLYLLVPMVLQAFGLHYLAEVFMPLTSLDTWRALPGTGAIGAAAILWMIWRWRRERARFLRTLPDGVSPGPSSA